MPGEKPRSITFAGHFSTTTSKQWKMPRRLPFWCSLIAIPIIHAFTRVDHDGQPVNGEAHSHLAMESYFCSLSKRAGPSNNPGRFHPQRQHPLPSHSLCYFQFVFIICLNRAGMYPHHSNAFCRMTGFQLQHRFRGFHLPPPAGKLLSAPSCSALPALHGCRRKPGNTNGSVSPIARSWLGAKFLTNKRFL